MIVIGRLLRWATDLTLIVGLLAVALMMFHITIDVVGKFALNEPVPATIALVSNYYMVVVAFLPIAYAETRNSHITVEVLTELFPQRGQLHLYSWSYLISALVYGLLTSRTWDEAVRTQEAGSFIMEQSTKLLTWPSYYLLPIGCGLMTTVLIFRFFIYLTGAESGLGEVPTMQKAAEVAAADEADLAEKG
ncbi:MAG: TRAP transporter small permease [Chromatiales bacterium]|jgi:TRAP-type C4-dicarboxylate transport system permease small subunit|nr:TRAP transporter small permease [Chromatiales bacterium]